MSAPFSTRRQFLGRICALSLLPAGVSLLAAAPTAAAAKPGFAAAASKTAAATQTGTITLGVWQEPSVLNPHLVGTGTGSGYYVLQALEGLMTVGPDGQFIPRLVQDVPTSANGGVSADGLTVTYKLKPDLKWSDGQPFSSDDVVYTYKYLIDPSIPTVSGDKYRKALKSVDAPDPQTIVLTFNQPYTAWPLLFNVVDVILPKHVLANDPNPGKSTFNQMPVGTGPFKVAAYTAGDSIQYVPNAYYREADKVQLAGLTLKIVPTIDALIAAIRAGAVDIAWSVREDGHNQLVGVPNVQLSEGPTAASERILLNLTDPSNPEAPGSSHPVLGDVRVRRAIEMAIDKTSIIQQLLKGATTVSSSFLSGPDWAVPTVPQVSFDPAQAGQMLDAAGWALGSDGVRQNNGVRATLDFETTSGDTLREQVQLLVRQNLADVGIEVNINNQPAKIFFGLGDQSGPPNKGQFDMAMFTNGPDPDPQQYLASWSTDGIPTTANKFSGAYNWSRFSSTEYDDLLTQASKTVDQGQRKAIYQRMAEIIEDQKPNIFLFNRLQVNAITPRVNGLVFNPWTDVTWNAADWSVSG